eukprot:3458789-Pyramimonas_sp.AAC.1
MDMPLSTYACDVTHTTRVSHVLLMTTTDDCIVVIVGSSESKVPASARSWTLALAFFTLERGRRSSRPCSRYPL